MARHPTYEKLREKAVETIRFMYLEPSETPDPTHPPIQKYAEAILDAIWPEIERLMQDVHATYDGAMVTLRSGLADQMDTFAEGGYGQTETKNWRRGMHDAANMLRSQAQGQRS